MSLFVLQCALSNFRHCIDARIFGKETEKLKLKSLHILIPLSLNKNKNPQRLFGGWQKSMYTVLLWVIFITSIWHFTADSLQLLLFCCRKHTLNCHRMRPALFQVLCEIKEKTGMCICVHGRGGMGASWKKYGGRNRCAACSVLSSILREFLWQPGGVW